MEPHEVARFAGHFSAMARIVGPDPKAVKMRRHAFHLHQSGVTTLSASAVLLPPGSLAEPLPFLDHICAVHGHAGGLALTTASLVEPFLVSEQRNSPSEELHPRLVPEARMDVLVEREESGNLCVGKSGAPLWLSAQLLALVDVPASSDSVLSLLKHEGSSIGSSSWDVGWSLAHANEKQVENNIRPSLESLRSYAYGQSTDTSLVAKSATRIAILGVPALTSDKARHVSISWMQQRGDSLLIIGSPFGILSPFHFFNSISVGVVSNCLPLGAPRSSLLMADIRCLPGMEGAPVFDKHSCLVGMLMKPLRQRGSGSEVQLVITWDAIATAWSSSKLEETGRGPSEVFDETIVDSKMIVSSSTDNDRRFVSNSASSLQKYSFSTLLREALSSIVLVTVGDASWASGIVLNTKGLVLTNAHLLEPWRFGRTSSLGLDNKITSFSEEHPHKGENKLLMPQACKVSNEEAVKNEVSLFNLGFKRERRISIRWDHGERQIWCSASVVFISKGPLDVALLQMEKVPIALRSITLEFVCPPAGSSVYVVGHGLLGPRSGLCSSLSSGVVSNIVRIPVTQHSSQSSTVDAENMGMPVMLQTTAAVHPGASGGVLINSHGRMVGLITSNAKHGGGNTIPHLNFSIPCKCLEKVFQYSEEGDLSILKQLDKRNELLSSVWALAPVSFLFLDSPPEKRNKAEKVSAFSQFLADKQEELKSHKDVEVFFRQKIPSKI